MTLVLASEQIAGLLPDVDVLGIVEEVFADLGSGFWTSPPPRLSRARTTD